MTTGRDERDAEQDFLQCRDEGERRVAAGVLHGGILTIITTIISILDECPPAAPSST
jgi:hypothetical protein